MEDIKDIDVKELELQNEEDYQELARQDLLELIRNEIVKVKTEIRKHELEYKREHILSCIYNSTMEDNKSFDFLNFSKENVDKFTDTMNQTDKTIKQLTAKHSILLTTYKRLYSKDFNLF